MSQGNITLTRKSDSVKVSVAFSKIITAVKYPGRVRPEDDLIEIDGVQYVLSSAATGIYTFESGELDGTAGNGAVGTIVLGAVPAGFIAYGRTLVVGETLASDTNAAELAVGIETDDATAFLPATVITTVNSVTGVGAVPIIKTAVARNIIGTVSGEAITSGSFKVQLIAFN